MTGILVWTSFLANYFALPAGLGGADAGGACSENGPAVPGPPLRIELPRNVGPSVAPRDYRPFLASSGDATGPAPRIQSTVLARDERRGPATRDAPRATSRESDRERRSPPAAGADTTTESLPELRPVVATEASVRRSAERDTRRVRAELSMLRASRDETGLGAARGWDRLRGGVESRHTVEGRLSLGAARAPEGRGRSCRASGSRLRATLRGDPEKKAPLSSTV